MARTLPVRHLEPHVARGVLDALHDRARRIDQRAVPVENDEAVFQRKVFFANASISAGSFDSKLSFSFCKGCSRGRLEAWRKKRFTPCFASARLRGKSPYLSSPRTGW